MNPIYLDHAATTPIAPEVLAAINETAIEAFANPGSQHAAGRKARRTLEDAKERTAELLGANTHGMDADRVIITSCGTESNNLLLAGLTHGRNGRVVISASEHVSVAEYAKVLTRQGYDVQAARIDSNGQLDLDHFRSLLTPETIVASVMLGNNETGVIQPVPEAAAICASAGVPLHTDASQAVGKIPIDFSTLGVSAMTVAPHKHHGPRGVGMLLLESKLTIEPMLHGGFQQLGFRPGTESVALVVGAMRALALAIEASDVAPLRDRFESAVTKTIADVRINGTAADRLPQISNLAFLGLDRQALLMALDLAGIACSTGSACASGSSEPSPTLTAMGLEKAVIDSSLRFSFATTNTTTEIDLAVERISNTVNKLRSS